MLFATFSFAQCVANPTGETAVGMRNATSYYLTFYVDGSNKGGVPAGDISSYFNVSPGDHALKAEAQAGGETKTASRTVTVGKGEVCTWTVTNGGESSLSLGAVALIEQG